MTNALPKKSRGESNSSLRSIDTGASDADSVLNRNALMDKISGDVGLLKELTDIFMEIMPVQLRTLEQGLSQGDAEAVRMAAHTIKGGTASLEGAAAAETAYKLEDLGRSGELENAPETLEQLRAELEQLRRALKEMAAELG